MHIILDRYAGAGTSMTALVPRTRDNFVPELRRCTGFQGYAAIASDQGDIIACALWDSADAAAEADPHVRTWLGSNLPELEHYTKRFSGDVDYHAVAGGSVADGSQSAHFSLSRSDNNLKTPLLQDTTVLMGQAVQNTLASVVRIFQARLRTSTTRLTFCCSTARNMSKPHTKSPLPSCVSITPTLISAP